MPTTPSPASGGSSAPIAVQLPERIGPFAITGVLGRGGMGVVFDAIAPQGQRVALKVIRPYGDPDRAELLVARFLREAKILEKIDHPGVVKLVASGETEGVLFLAMERIEGVSLLTIRRQGPLGLQPLAALGAQIADALAHMHDAGVVHRDIKPANILVDRNGQPIITDFGISGLAEATGITRQGDLLGSPGFMAPEVIEGHTPTVLSDQFSLGRLLYELGALGAAKRLPRGAPILEVLQSALEIDWGRFPTGERWDPLQAILQKMVAHDPEQRFPSAHQALAALRAVLGSDVLDSDTLSEHVGKMPVSTSWEVLAQDLAIDATEPPADPTPALPPFGARRLPPTSEDEPTQLDIDFTNEVMKPRDLAKILEPIEPIEPTDPPSEPSPELVRLLRQVGSLQKDLERARAKRTPAPSSAPWIAIAFFALLAGAIAGYIGGSRTAPDGLVVMVPSDPSRLIEPRYAHDAKRGIPSDQDRTDAREMLKAALENLSKQDLESAERLLGLCIQIADLPDCHKTVAAILALRADPAAREHLKRYVELAPDAPEAARIRMLLDI